MAEIELSAISKQCLDRRIPTQKFLEQEVLACVKERNEKEIKITWQFTTNDAREKLKDSKELVGFANLESISWISRHAFVGILCLFHEKFRGKGYGKDAMLLLLDYGFSILDLHCIVLWVESFNEHAIQLYERIGFRKGGVMRELAYRNGKRTDVVTMDILQREFVERYGILAKGNVF